VGIIIIGYYLLKFVGRLLFPIVIKKAVNNMQARQYTYSQKKPEGEVTVQSKPGKQRPSDNQQGEYVDFEEVE
jgi:hypothetical protein